MPSSSSWGAQVRYVRCTSAPRESSLLSTEEPLLSLAIFYCFKSFGGTISPSSMSFPFLFFLCKLRSGCKPRGEGKWGRGGLGGSWVFGASLDDDPFLLATKSLRPLLGFKTISSSSSQLVSTWTTTSLGEWAAESLSNSASESENSTGLSSAPSSSSSWNWSISASRERHEEVVSSLRTATSHGECWKGSSTGGRSSRAKKPGRETSIRWILGPQHLVESRDVDKTESRSNMHFICKNIRGVNHGQINEIHRRSKKKVLERKDGKAKGAKSHAEGPKPKVPHLDLPPKLGNKDHRAIPQRRSSSHPSCLCWT